MNKKTIRIAGWALGLSMAVTGIGVAAGALYSAPNQIEVHADGATDFVSLANGKGTTGTGSSVSVKSHGVTLTFSKGYGASTTDLRNYASGTITLDYDSSVASVSAITMTITGGKDGSSWTGATLKDGVVTWNSTAKGTTVTNGTQARFSAISVTYTPADITNLTAISAVSLSDASVPVNTLKTVTATATFAPIDADEIIDWQSSDEDVATIEASGTYGIAVITPVGEGTCTFTASNQSETITRTSATFTVTAAEASQTISIYESDSSFAKVGSGSGYAPYNGDHSIDGYTINSSQVMIQSHKVQFQKNAGVIYNKSEFGYNVGLIKTSGGTAALTVKYNSSSENPATTNCNARVQFGNDSYYVPSGSYKYFRMLEPNVATATYSLIEVMSENAAAIEFAELYLAAYVCDGSGASDPTMASANHTTAKLSSLYGYLSSATKTILENAVKAHTQDYGADKLKEFGERYYWIVKNHGTATYDFMELDGTVSFSSFNADNISSSNQNNPLPLIITVIAASAIVSGGLFFLQRKHRKED